MQMRLSIEQDDIIAYLKKQLSEKRYIHSLEVSKTAEALALRYGGNEQKAKLAGLVHDVCRELDAQIQLENIKKEGLFLDDMPIRIPELLHGPAAIYICKKTFDIADEDILNAVQYHTTGRVNMSLLEKIIFLADFIEPGRSFNGVENLRELAFLDLNRAVIAAFDSSINYIILKNGLIHPNTILARNDVLLIDNAL